MVALCGLGYELLAGAVSSYFLGNTILQFSLTIGVFLSAMGLGSHLSGKVGEEIMGTFLAAELALALVGGYASFIFFLVYTYFSDIFYPVFFGVLVVLGTLTGLEIPLLIRLFKEYGTLSASLARVLSIDYLGALAASVTFPLLLLPRLGLMQAAFFYGLLNLLAAVWFIAVFKDRLPGVRRYQVISMLLAVALFVGFGLSSRLVRFFENRMYTDEILMAQQTPYQRVVLTRYGKDLRLFLDGNLQFCSLDEYRYHEALVHPAAQAAGRRSDVLILGGGDGLAVRELLKYEDVEKIRLVDLDPAVVKLGRSNPHLVALNEGALLDPRVEVIQGDAFPFLEKNEEFYDLILVDLPDPHNYSLAKLYSKQFYQLLKRRLGPSGVVCIQATSPYYASRTFWCIASTVEAAGLAVVPLHVMVPSLGDWGFVLATDKPLDASTIEAPKVTTRYLNPQQMQAIFSLPEDVARLPVKVSTLNNGAVVDYYEDDWGRWR